MVKAEIIQKIESAERAIVAAQANLSSVLSELETARRAEKRHVSDVLKEAFDRLRVAQTELTALTQMLARD